jgi:hypothetical protein
MVGAVEKIFPKRFDETHRETIEWASENRPLYVNRSKYVGPISLLSPPHARLNRKHASHWDFASAKLIMPVSMRSFVSASICAKLATVNSTKLPWVQADLRLFTI